MTRNLDVATAHAGHRAPSAPGVTRYDVLCHRGATDDVLNVVDRWARDRAVSETRRRRLVRLVDVALRHGLRYEPRALTVLLRWADLERVRVDLRWHGGREEAQHDDACYDLDVLIALLDDHTSDWGVGRTRTGWMQWLVVGV